MATDDKALVVVCDAGPLIHLDELNGLGLLSDFAKILVPAAVASEVIPYRPTIFARTELNWVRCSPALPCAQDSAVLCRIFSLHAGEIEALAQMKRYPASMLLTDDSAARWVADRMGYKVHGSIGIIVRAIRTSRMTPFEVVTRHDPLADTHIQFAPYQVLPVGSNHHQDRRRI